MLETLLQDLRFAARMLRLHPLRATALLSLMTKLLETAQTFLCFHGAPGETTRVHAPLR
ncbi:hypothetical protein D3C83_249790 [compost metagenome]